jgi:hypothetical protein
MAQASLSPARNRSTKSGSSGTEHSFRCDEGTNDAGEIVPQKQKVEGKTQEKGKGGFQILKQD